MKNLPLTPNELDILLVLWKEGHSLSKTEILEKSPDKDWNPNSIHLMLNNMIKKGALMVDGYVRCSLNYGRTYAPTMTQLDYATNEALKLTPNLPKDERIFGLVCTLVTQKEVSAETINKLSNILEEQKAKFNITE